MCNWPLKPCIWDVLISMENPLRMVPLYVCTELQISALQYPQVTPHVPELRVFLDVVLLDDGEEMSPENPKVFKLQTRERERKGSESVVCHT